MSITRLVSLCCLLLFASATAAVVLLPEVPATAFGWRMPEPPFGALLFALVCALVQLPWRASARSTRSDRSAVDVDHEPATHAASQDVGAGLHGLVQPDFGRERVQLGQVQVAREPFPGRHAH